MLNKLGETWQTIVLIVVYILAIALLAFASIRYLNAQEFAPLVVDPAYPQAYRQVQNLGPTSQGDFVLIEAGTVNSTAQSLAVCDQTQIVGTHGQLYYRVDRRQVTWTGNNKPATAWAKCVCSNNIPQIQKVRF